MCMGTCRVLYPAIDFPVLFDHLCRDSSADWQLGVQATYECLTRWKRAGSSSERRNICCATTIQHQSRLLMGEWPGPPSCSSGVYSTLGIIVG